MRWRRRWLVLALLPLLASPASAHAVGGSRLETPVPPGLVYLGAATTVAVTAGWLSVAGRHLRGDRYLHVGSIPAPVWLWLRRLARGGFLLSFAAVIATGLLGRQVRAENVATVFAWPVWLKGVGLLAIVAGSPWRVLSPWRTLYDGLARLECGEIALVGSYPPRLAEWPALVGFALGVGILENLTTVPRSPRLTAIVVAGYALAMVLGGLAFGRDWFRRADALEVVYGLFGRVAPLSVHPAGDGGASLGLRPPWQGCRRPVRSVAAVAVVVAMVYTVSFDGYTGTQSYQRVLFDARGLLGMGGPTDVLLYTVGLAGFVVAFALAAAIAGALGSLADDRTADTEDTGWHLPDLLVAFAPTLLPIAAAYEVAHTYAFVARNLGQLVAVVAEPVAPAVEPVQPLGWLPLEAFWGSQVLLIVGGHVAAVVAAHAVALDRFAAPTDARRGHLPLVVVMVGYTVLSLWIVTQPIAGG